MRTKSEKLTAMNDSTDGEHSSKSKNSTLSKPERIQELSNVIEELNTLCRDLDPYQPIDTKTQEQLKRYGVFEIDNPFVITNKLVLILENAVEELIELGGNPELG